MKILAVDATGKKNNITVNQSDIIGEGATATIYSTTLNNELWAAKIYKKDREVPSEKLEAMLQSTPENLFKNLNHQIFVQYAWVKFLLKDSNNKIIGFLMPFVDHHSTNSLDSYYDPVLIKRLQGIAQSALSLRLEIALNLCALINDLHSKGHYFIDIKPQNIRVYRDNNSVVLLDCDGYSIKNVNEQPKRFSADLISTDFIAPEVLKNNLSPKSLGLEQDLYGLAVLLFQMFNRGTHPFQGIIKNPNIQVSTNDERAALGFYPYGITPHKDVNPRPQSIHNLLLPETRQLFDRAFTTISRPTAKEWMDHLHAILNNKSLTRCTTQPNDIRHIHFKDMGCIGCFIKNETRNLSSKPTQPRKYQVNTNDSTSPSSASTQNYSSTSNTKKTHQYSPSNNKSNRDSEWWFFITIFAIIIVAIIYILSESSKSSSEPISNQPPLNQTSAISNCGDLNIPHISNKQLCDYYYSDNYRSCDSLFTAQLTSREARVSPQSMCGQPNLSLESNETNAANNDIVINRYSSMSDKVEYLSSISSSVRISENSVSQNSEAVNYYFDVVNDIIQNFNKATVSTYGSSTVFAGTDVSYVSFILFDGHIGDDCNSQSIGQAATCTTFEDQVICNQTNESPSIKLLCVASFSK
jgi:serine/threonine protein kinase